MCSFSYLEPVCSMSSSNLALLFCFPGGSDSKESTCNVGGLSSIPGLGMPPGGGHGNPLQYPHLENPHRQRSLAGYSPWGRKESTGLSGEACIALTNRSNSKMLTLRGILVASSLRGDISEMYLKSYYQAELCLL